MSETTLEQRIQELNLNAPRVKPSDLDEAIASIVIVKHVTPSGSILRWAVLNLKNGFSVTGKPSASVSAANDNQEIGEKVAIENARSELWAFMGFRLKEQAYLFNTLRNSTPE